MNFVTTVQSLLLIILGVMLWSQTVEVEKLRAHAALSHQIVQAQQGWGYFLEGEFFTEAEMRERCGTKSGGDCARFHVAAAPALTCTTEGGFALWEVRLSNPPVPTTCSEIEASNIDVAEYLNVDLYSVSPDIIIRNSEPWAEGLLCQMQRDGMGMHQMGINFEDGAAMSRAMATLESCRDE